MPHEKARNSPPSNTLDRRRALTISPELKCDNCQTESPLKIPRRVSSAEDECVEIEVSKAPKKNHSKIHWTQLGSNGTSSQSDHRLQTTSDQKRTRWQTVHRRQVKIVLEDVLQTEIGQSLLRSNRQSFKLTNVSESKREAREKQSDQTSKTELKNKRTSVTLKGGTDSTELKASSPSHCPTESCTQNESSPCKETKHPKSNQLNSSLKLSESSEVSSDSCTPRESDSPQSVQIIEYLPEQTKTSTVEENEAPLLEGSPQREEAVSPRCEFGHSPSSPLAMQETKSRSEHLANMREMTETQECQEDAKEDENEKHIHRNGEMTQEVEEMRGSVLCLSVGIDGEVPLKRCRLDGLSGEHVPDSEPNPECAEGRSFIRQSSKPNPPEPIVLSSEEEEEDEEEREESEDSVLNIQAPEGAKDAHRVERPTRVCEQKKMPELHPQITEIYTQCQSSSMLELQLSSLHMGGISVTSSGNIKITSEMINISLKDSPVKISLAIANVLKYSVWEGTALKGCGLVKDDEIPPPSLLLLWLSDPLARRLHNDMSVFQPDTRSAEGSSCVLLCLAEPVAGIERAVLASLMDMVGLNQCKPDLLTPLTQSDSLKLLQTSQETHLLQLLTAKSDSQNNTAAAVSASASQESDIQLKSVYTLCHRRAQGSNSIFMAPAPGPEWTPYRHCGPTRRLIQFPPPPSKGAITITTEDLECLDSGEFLNDVIIDFYLKYLLVQKAPQASVARSHVFSSFFYKQLTRRDNANEDSTSTPAQVRRHQRVRTWTRHVDIFDKDFLFVPVNQEAHWYLVVICFPGLEEPQYVTREGRGSVLGDGLEDLGESQSEGEIQGDNKSNSDEDKDPDDSCIKPSTSPDPPNCTENTCKRHIVCIRPCILIMDSLKLSVHERIFKLLREYLQMEWEVKRGGYRDFSVDHMVGSHCKVPLQDNSSDCGLYLLQYAESFLQDPVVHFDLPLRLERWFPRQQVRGKREEIRDLILHLYRFQQGSFGNEALENRSDDGNIIQ
ncbi:sentrin-specific protease 6-like isoform X2 [Myxocyprinus asiaticus]|uniref:sentrin-specific protease 6-like isoform X2 n=1 Tax=Myxocyprinus asiaticus TaxID=70543 RepID=UPI002222A963|nr:sentrin-specific protease 6-like isoform X2 [Myxocyprinus asiaticus]